MNNSIKDGGGNTRPNPQTEITTHLDYLRVSGKLTVEKFQSLILYLQSGESDDVWVRPEIPWCAGAGSVWYENTIQNATGMHGGFTFDEDEQTYLVMIDFPGQYFSGITVINQWRLLRGLYFHYKLDCSRIDLAIDDKHYNVVPVAHMRKGWYEGDNFGFKNYKQVTSGKSRDDMHTTDYYGSRSSGKMVRVYDHDGESLRFEAEFKRRYSRQIYAYLSIIEREWFTSNDCMDAKQKIKEIFGEDSKHAWMYECINQLHGCKNDFDIILQKVIGAIAVNAIDFRDRSSRKDKNKASYKDTMRMSYYQEFIDKVGYGIRLRVPVVKSTIQTTIAWMQRQVSKTLCIIRDSLGALKYREWESKLLENASKKLTIPDLKKVLYYKSNQSLLALE